MNEPTGSTPSSGINDLGLQAKIGSVLVHVDEGLSASGSHFDWSVVETMLKDPDIQTWLEELRKMALLPVKR